MAVNWYAQDLPTQSSGTMTIPPAVRAKLLADQMVLQQAGSTDTPIYSPAVGWAKIAAGALGGYLHGKELSDIQQKQNDAWASLLGPQASAGVQAPPPSASPMAAGSSSPPMADATPAPSPAALPPIAPPAPPQGFTPPPMSGDQMASAVDPNAGWANPGSVPTLGAPVPGLSPGAPPQTPAAPPPQVAQATPMPPPQQAAPIPQPTAPAASAPSQDFSAGVNLDPATRARYAAILRDPYASDQQKAMVLQRLIPPILPPEKLGPGETLVNPNNGARLSNPKQPEWSMGADGLLYEKNSGRVMTPDGQPVAKQAGQGAQAGYDPWKPLTVDEKRTMGVDPSAVILKNQYSGEYKFPPPSTTVNVGADGSTNAQVRKSLMGPLETFVGDGAKSNPIESNTQALNDLRALQAYVNNMQQQGGTTGIATAEITKAKGLANSLANVFGIKDPFDISNPEGIAKFSRQLAVAQLQASTAGTGGRMTNMALDNALKSTPGNDISLPGNQRLLGLMIQQKQRNIEIGQAIRSRYAQVTREAVKSGRQPEYDPSEMFEIIDNYDKAHPPIDPLTGEDLTQVQNNPGGPRPASAAPAGTPAPPKIGEVQDGHRYNGGDPANPASWSPVP